MNRRTIMTVLSFAAAAICAATAVEYATRHLALASDGTGIAVGPFAATVGFLGATALSTIGWAHCRGGFLDQRLTGFGLAALAAGYTAANGFGLSLSRSDVSGVPVALHVAGLAIGGLLFISSLTDALRTSTEASPRA